MEKFDALLAKFYILIFDPLAALFFALALVYFVWGTAMFVKDSGSDGGEDRQRGIRHMIWGVVGMFLMVAVFGIMHAIGDTIGADTSAIPGNF